MIQHLFEISKFTTIKDFQYSEPTVASYVYSALNTLFATTLKVITLSYDKVNAKLNDNIKKLKDLFFALLSVYLAFILCQAFLGYYLLANSHREEKLFLTIPANECQELKRQCSSFILNSQVNYCHHHEYRMHDMTMKEKRMMQKC